MIKNTFEKLLMNASKLNSKQQTKEAAIQYMSKIREAEETFFELSKLVYKPDIFFNENTGLKITTNLRFADCKVTVIFDKETNRPVCAKIEEMQ